MPITLKTFDTPVDAHLVKSLLESQGIWCALQNENIASVYPLSSFALGGIKLVIHEEDKDKALEIISQSAHHQKDKKNKLRSCINCNSTRITKHKPGASILMAVLLILGGAFFPSYFKEKWQCKDCHHTFKV